MCQVDSPHRPADDDGDEGGDSDQDEGRQEVDDELGELEGVLAEDQLQDLVGVGGEDLRRGEEDADEDEEDVAAE